MEIKVNKIDSANVKVEGALLISDIEKKVEKIVSDAAKNMKIDGFRKGKIPLTVVKKRFGDKLNQDAENEVLRELLAQAIKDLKVAQNEIMGEPLVSKYEKGADKIEVEIKLSLKPAIEVGEYLLLTPKVEKIEVSDAEINERIENLAKAQAPLKKIKGKRGLVNGDYALIDFEGFVDEKPFEGGKSTNYTLEIGSGNFIVGFEEQLLGMKADDEEDIKVTFPKDYQNKELAGKDAVFKVKLHEIQEKEKVQIDDGLAKNILKNEENPTLSLLKEKVAEQIKSEKKEKLYNELKPILLDKLIEAINFDLPEVVVEQELDLVLNNKFRVMLAQELKEYQESAEKVKDLREFLKSDAIKSVKATFIVDALSKIEEIDASENEVAQQIYYEALQYGQEPRKLIEIYQKQGLIPAIKMAIVEDKLLSALLDKKLQEAK